MEQVIFGGTTAGRLIAYHADSGEILWSHQFQEGTRIVGGAVAAEGMVFVGAGYHSALGGARRGEGNEFRAFSIGGR